MKHARAGQPARQSRPRPGNPSAHLDRPSRQQVRRAAVAGRRILRRGERAAAPRTGRAQHAYRIADHRDRAVHRSGQQGRRDRQAAAQRGNRAQVSRPRRRPGHPIPGRAAAAVGVCARAAEADARPRTEDYHRAGTRDGRQRRRARDAGALQQGDRRQALHRDRRRDERSDPAGALRGLPSIIPPVDASHGAEDRDCRRGRSGMRERRLLRARARDARAARRATCSP